MTEKSFETIINEEIDGTATPEDSARLKQALATDEEARLYHEDLQRLNSAMAALDPVDPPPELKANILRAITPDPAPAARPSGDGWMAALLNPFKHFRPAYGATFAGGLAAGLALFALLNIPGTMDNDSLSGMMAPQQTFDSYTLGETAPFSVGSSTGVLETRYSGNLVLTKITLDAPEDLEILTQFDQTALSPVGYRSLHPSKGEVFMGAQEFRLHHQGQNSYWLVFQETGISPSRIHVTLTSGDLVYKKSLKTRGGDS